MEEVMISAPAEKKTRNQTFDFLKGVACILVVISHSNFPGMVGDIFIAFFCKWLVPLFAVISGYFYRKEDIGYCLKKVKHMFLLCLYATLFYIVVKVGQNLQQGELILALKASFTAKRWFEFLVLNHPVFIEPAMWYLFAMLYMYLLYALMIKIRVIRFEKGICVFLFLMYFVVMTYGSKLIFGKTVCSVSPYLYRNFLFVCMPFFLLGKWLYRASCHVIESRKIQFSNVGLWMIAFGFCAKYIEICVTQREYPYQVCTIIIVVGMMLFALVDRIPKALKPLCDLGRRYSLMVYVLHPVVYRTMDAFMAHFAAKGKITYGYSWVRPILTVVLTILVAVAFEEMKSMWKKRKAIDAVQNAATCS